MIIRKTDFSLTTNAQGMELKEHGTPLFPISCYEENVAAETVIWHWHEDWEIVEAVEGTVVVAAVYPEHCRLEPGQGIFLNSGIPHEIFGEGERAILRSAVFHPRITGSMDSVYWQKYVEPVTRNPACRSVFLNGEEPWHRPFLAAFEAAWQAVDREAPCYEFEVRGALSEIARLLYLHFPARQKTVSPGERRDMERIKVMLRFIRDHYGEELSVARIAESAAISESECLRCFRKTIASTPMQYVKQFRVQRAADLLLSTDRKIVDVAMDCGFSDAAYFIRQFKSVKGGTPREYRERHRKEAEGL